MSIINDKYHNLSNFKNQFKAEKPFPHLILDNFLKEDYFSDLKLDHSIDFKDKGKSFNSDAEKEKWISKNVNLPKLVSNIVNELNSDNWIENLKSLTDIKSLFATDVGNTDLANYHEMYKNGFLGSHVDHSSDPKTGLPHVLNIILYLTQNLTNNWGGNTVFMSKDGKKIIKEIDYIPNRAVLFLHTPYSFHGVTKLINNKNKRSTIYVDYYSENKDPYQNYKLDFGNKFFNHGTCFVLPKTLDYLKPKNFYYLRTRLGYIINQIIK